MTTSETINETDNRDKEKKKERWIFLGFSMNQQSLLLHIGMCQESVIRYYNIQHTLQTGSYLNSQC